MRLFTLVLAGMILWQGGMKGPSDYVVWCDSSRTTICAIDVPKQSVPIVTDAISEKHLAHKKGDSYNVIEFGGLWVSTYRENVYRQRWTCSNKSDFLLTSEDGSKHVCVRFQ